MWHLSFRYSSTLFLPPNESLNYSSYYFPTLKFLRSLLIVTSPFFISSKFLLLFLSVFFRRWLMCARYTLTYPYSWRRRTQSTSSDWRKCSVSLVSRFRLLCYHPSAMPHNHILYHTNPVSAYDLSLYQNYLNTICYPPPLKVAAINPMLISYSHYNF